MRFALIDVLDVFDFGGYLDLRTGQHIYPKWYSDEFFPELKLTSEDYQFFASHPERFLTTPVMRMSASVCRAAMAMGNITREQLMEIGFNQPEQWEPFYREPQTVEGTVPQCTDEEWEASKRVDDYMRKHGVYIDYIIMKSKLTIQLVKDWLTQHGIEYYSTSQS